MTEARTAPTMTIDSRLEEIPRLARWVNELLRNSPFKESLVFDMQVCLEEAIANIVLHAFKGEAGHPIQITVAVGANDVQLDIEDSDRHLIPAKWRR
jgi:serine/threonine-protein kinase RsbW